MMAYFSMEYALRDLPFAGGLGVLAADYLLECGKQNFPLVAVGLSYGKQAGVFDYGGAKLVLLESSFTQPYDIDLETQIKKELFLAFEGVKKLAQLGIKPDVYHLNEGHTAFVILALMKSQSSVLGSQFSDSGLSVNQSSVNKTESGKTGKPHSENRKPKTDYRIVATKHTVLSASGLHIPREIFQKYVSPDETIYNLGSDQNHPEFFSSNKFMLRHASAANGVSVKHIEVEREVHLNSPLFPITNGINPDRWQAENFNNQTAEGGKQKMDLENLEADPSIKMSNGQDQENPTSAFKKSILSLQHQNKKVMIDFVNKETGSSLKPDMLTIVWARRLAHYKQPELILDVLPKVANLPVQFIVAGQTDPADPSQQSIVERLEAHRSETFAFLPRYSLEIAKILTSGADVWLNTPMVGKEACGTSTMKSALNGSLLLTTSDGWISQENWAEGGAWIVGDISEIISREILPLFGQPDEWQKRMNSNRNLILKKYTTARMLEEYKEKLYNLSSKSQILNSK